MQGGLRYAFRRWVHSLHAMLALGRMHLNARSLGLPARVRKRTTLRPCHFCQVGMSTAGVRPGVAMASKDSEFISWAAPCVSSVCGLVPEVGYDGGCEFLPYWLLPARMCCISECVVCSHDVSGMQRIERFELTDET